MKKKELESYSKRKDIVIEDGTAKWNIRYNGEINGLYTGQFVFKCFLNPTEKLAAGRDYRELLGPNAVMALKHEDNLAFSLSQLKYRIISAPPFWSSTIGQSGFAGDLPDEKVIDLVLEAAIASELKYLALMKKKKEDVLEKGIKAGESILGDVEEEDEDSKDNADND